MTIHFHDVSHYNGAYQPTGPTFAKATEGVSNVDPQYAGIRARTLAGGWPFLAYHFLHRGQIAEQVDHVIATIGADHPLMLDVERPTVGPNPALLDVTQFMDLYAAKGGRVVLVYLPHWYWQAIASPPLKPIADRGAGLISSVYPSSGYSDSGEGWAPYGGLTPVIWQYTSTPLDTNAYRGTVAELAALIEGDTVTPDDVKTLLTADVIPTPAALLARFPTIGATCSLQTLITRLYADMAPAGPTAAQIAAAVVPAVVKAMPAAAAVLLTPDDLAKIAADVHAEVSKLSLVVAP